MESAHSVDSWANRCQPNLLLEMVFRFPSHTCAFENCKLADRPLKVMVYFNMSPKLVKTLGIFEAQKNIKV